MRTYSLCTSSLLLIITCSTAASQVQTSQALAKQAEAVHDSGQQKLFEIFTETLTRTVLIGHYTILGNDPIRPLHEERYELRRVTKMAAGDYWLFQARIKYGKHDLTVPLPLEVKWAGSTPVITVDNVTIPALGTFNARVIIDGNRYAGTWSHGAVGGHLFGKIEKRTEPSGDQPSKNSSKNVRQ